MRCGTPLIGALAMAASLAVPASAAEPKPIPVYPRARLEGLDEAETRCCDFASKDSCEKVVACYEKSLGRRRSTRRPWWRSGLRSGSRWSR